MRKPVRFEMQIYKTYRISINHNIGKLTKVVVGIEMHTVPFYNRKFRESSHANQTPATAVFIRYMFIRIIAKRFPDITLGQIFFIGAYRKFLQTNHISILSPYQTNYLVRIFFCIFHKHTGEHHIVSHYADMFFGQYAFRFSKMHGDSQSNFGSSINQSSQRNKEMPFSGQRPEQNKTDIKNYDKRKNKCGISRHQNFFRAYSSSQQSNKQQKHDHHIGNQRDAFH